MIMNFYKFRKSKHIKVKLEVLLHLLHILWNSYLVWNWMKVSFLMCVIILWYLIYFLHSNLLQMATLLAYIWDMSHLNIRWDSNHPNYDFLRFSRSLQEMLGECLKLGHNQTFPHLFQFLTHYQSTIHVSTPWATGSFIKYAINKHISILINLPVLVLLFT
jgi:hypothetical protein